MTSKRLIGIAKAAELLGVGISTLRAWDDSGALKAERTKGGHRRYRIEDIEQLQGIVSEDAPPNDCAAIYVRVSSHDQKQKGKIMSNMTNQVDEYVNYSKQKKSQNNRSAKICLDYIDNNNQLSWTAKGIFIYLASRPTEDISIKDICDVSQDSLGYVEVGLKELERAKLLYILDTTEKATGKQRQSQMFIFNRPTSKKEAIKEISKKYNLNINDGEENMTTENYINYDVCDEPMFIHKCIMDQFFKTNYPSELLSLYLFYYYQEKYNGFETNGISVKEISKIFSWPLEKTKKIKDLMFSLDLRTPY